MFLILRPGKTAPASTIYSIDFIGPGETAVVEAMGKTPEPASAAKKPAAPVKKAADNISVSKSKYKNQPLPAPSVLKTTAKTKTGKDAASDKKLSDEQPFSGVSADFPNFPYPWYVTQVRTALWDEWSSRMPAGGQLSCVVLFRINRKGSINKIEVERNSGNKLFDFSAVSSVQQSAPFPPLPAEFEEDALIVHVEFRAGT